MWCTKSQFFDSPSAYGAKRSSNGRRDLPKLSSKCIPKHPKSTTKMHRSAIYTHRERENRWFHRCRKSNENVNYKIACFSLPCVRIGLQWSPAPSKKCWKFIKKQQKIFQEPCRVHSSAVRTSCGTILCAFESWDRAPQHPHNNGARFATTERPFSSFVSRGGDTRAKSTRTSQWLNKNFFMCSVHFSFKMLGDVRWRKKLFFSALPTSYATFDGAFESWARAW